MGNSETRFMIVETVRGPAAVAGSSDGVCLVILPAWIIPRRMVRLTLDTRRRFRVFLDDQAPQGTQSGVACH